MNSSDLVKSKIHVTTEIIEYVCGAILSKTIIRKSTGNISAMSFDAGEELAKKTSPFDIYIQIIEGKAEVIINKTSYLLESGESVIIPAHKSNLIRANERFKMIQTVIKSGYE